MTREEAIALMQECIGATVDWDPNTARDIETALTTLAPAVRYEPPTVEEVGDDDNDLLWAWRPDYASWTKRFGRWELRPAWYVRRYWGRHNANYTAWLPYTAIPEGGA